MGLCDRKHRSSIVTFLGCLRPKCRMWTEPRLHVQLFVCKIGKAQGAVVDFVAGQQSGQWPQMNIYDKGWSVYDVMCVQSPSSVMTWMEALSSIVYLRGGIRVRPAAALASASPHPLITCWPRELKQLWVSSSHSVRVCCMCVCVCVQYLCCHAVCISHHFSSSSQHYSALNLNSLSPWLIWLGSPRPDLLSWDQRFQAFGVRLEPCCSLNKRHPARNSYIWPEIMLLCNFSAASCEIWWPLFFFMIWQTYDVSLDRWRGDAMFSVAASSERPMIERETRTSKSITECKEQIWCIYWWYYRYYRCQDCACDQEN